MSDAERPEIAFVPLSTDEGKIRFFGTLMPALLLLKASPVRFVQLQAARRSTPRIEVESFVASAADDAAQADGTMIFVHRWESDGFDALAFARAKTFLAQITRMVKREGYSAQPLDPLSPRVNLPKLAARAGLGSLSPYGLLVHPTFGPRLILTALTTDHPLAVRSRWEGSGCSDCMSCVEICPQEPFQKGVIRLGECQRCAECLVVCPTGKG
jgi:NAD-dependent dihydropyrimidine dehydrogenase PreA subunit